MKKIFVILLLLCPFLYNGTLSAQIYTVSSTNYKSFMSGGSQSIPSIEFRSTSSYSSVVNTSAQTSYTTSLQLANGRIKTSASSVTGGVLAENATSLLDEGNSTTTPQIPGVPDTFDGPLNDGWDVALLLAGCCLLYAIYIRRKILRNNK